MDIIKLFIDSIANGIIIDINKVIKKKKESIEVVKMSSLKMANLLIFSICFLLGNFTSMLAVLLKDNLGYGIIFPLASCIFLYCGCIVSLRGIYLFNKEKEFFVKKIEYDKKEDSEIL